MKKPDKSHKATVANLKGRGKVSSALTGPGLLMPGELNDVSGGSAVPDTAVLRHTAATTVRCL